MSGTDTEARLAEIRLSLPADSMVRAEVEDLVELLLREREEADRRYDEALDTIAELELEVTKARAALSSPSTPKEKK